MKNYKKIFSAILLLLTSGSAIFVSCTKYGNGFLSPSVQYAVNEFTVIRGRVATSYSLTTDGSSVPMHVKWTHIYDEAGNIVDTLFSKKYTVPVWTSAYDPLVDLTYATIIAKRMDEQLTPIVVNESNGTIEANTATRFLPIGSYAMDVEITNAAGTETLKNIIKITLVDGKDVETSPETGSFRNQLIAAGGSAGKADMFNGANNPFDSFTVTRFADTPNIFILKVTDRFGVPFDPKSGEFAKRPSTGLNPVPPFLQNLEYYAPDTFLATDSTISIKYPLVPFPLASLGNGFNMYYVLPTQHVQIDSTSSWSSNTAGNYYKGPEDSHYKGIYPGGEFDYGLRIPLRIQVPGAYYMNIKILNATHR